MPSWMDIAANKLICDAKREKNTLPNLASFLQPDRTAHSRENEALCGPT